MSGEAPDAGVAGTPTNTQPAAEQPVQSIEQDCDTKSLGNNTGTENKGDDTVNSASEAPVATATATPTAAAPAHSTVSEVTADQWRSMMDVVMAIYEFREEECVYSSKPEQTHANGVSATTILRDFSIAVLTNDTSLTTTISSKNLWHLVS